jgi:hypothetical protein
VVVQDDDAEVLGHGLLKLTLLWLKEKAVFLPAEHLSDNLMVTGKFRMRDEDVIQVGHDVSRQDEVLEDVIHRRLECSW